MKRTLSVIAMLLTLCMLPLSFFGCDSGAEKPTEAPTEAPTAAPTDAPTDKPTARPTQPVVENPYEDEVLEETVYYFDDEESLAFIKTLGRTMLDEDRGICCDHTATGIEFNGVIEGDVELEVYCQAVDDNEAYLTVFVDGERMEDTYAGGKRSEGYCHVTEGEDTITVAFDLTKGMHNIQIIKQTESNYSLLAFSQLTVTGYLTERPEDKELYIEFIGDSLTCAMGAAGNTSIKGGGSAQGRNGADWEDGTLGYSFLTAQELDADWSIVSESGIGICESWFGPAMPNHYFKTSYRRSTTESYDFERTPDLVVINLGTNDFYLNTTNGWKDKNIMGRIKNETKGFIEDIREAYGSDVPVVWVSGVWTGIDSVVSEIDLALDELGGEAEGIYHLKLAANDENGKGAEGHPSSKGHQQTKRELVEFINSKNILD